RAQCDVGEGDLGMYGPDVAGVLFYRARRRFHVGPVPVRAGPVDSRTTSSTSRWRVTGAASVAPSAPRAMSRAAMPIACSGRRTVVSDGDRSRETSMSLNPATEMSPGT